MTPASGPGYDAVVVHYENPEVYGVIGSLASQASMPARVLVVDNSASIDRALLPPAPFAVDVIGPAGNGGYAAAVNAAREHLVGGEPYLLVLTHEVVLDEDCAAALSSLLDERPRAGSAGPVLRLRSAPERIFSGGGTLDAAAWPRHIHDAPDGEAAVVAWIDGSVMMLRRQALDQAGWLDDGYFLYFEEIDLAARLKAKGWDTVVVSRAAAWQEPGGYPPFLALRNRVRLVRAFPGLLRIPFPIFVVRLLAEVAWVARRRGAASALPSLRGLAAGLRGRSGRPA